MDGTSTKTTNGLGLAQNPSASSDQDHSVSTLPEFSAGCADDTRSSISSDKSDSKPPRSAMRRTSSIPKIPQSPRRVRFDFMGEEVLPTTSPQPSAFISARIPSPDPLGDETNCASHLATEPGEEEEEEQAPPRKVSSSDALRALSRAPLEEDGTVWTVVNSDQEESPLDQPSHTLEGKESVGAEAASTTPNIEVTRMTNDLESAPTATNFESSYSSSTVGNFKGDLPNSEEDSSEDDFLAMAKPKTPASSESRAQALLSPTKSAKPASPVQSGEQSPASPRSKKSPGSYRGIEGTQKVPATIDDDGDLFHFEEEGLQLPEHPRPTQPPINQKEQDDEHSDHEDSNGTPTPQPLSLYATSPAVPITKLADREREPDPPTPSRAKFEPNTVGSYKGRPLTMPIIRNPQILSQLESGQAVNEVVGSVHHRGPGDDFNPLSLQETSEQIMAFSASRSFSERLMMEDMMEAAKARSTESGNAPTLRGQ
ncbi:hypothetical protein VFPPC_02934 [Pochonia chlamydosporia 170]|uniref:Uncharacterized protein n=1 Tax=Pochonia chlamydosporia 170 TaxID=1380566 RepID=A0A179FZK0_METCM|nr:hypothetical protein VFPPC_02934 [Pochonia chlamydosporia 170]OAQ70473.1 hypothetical protein VFPPC_02934 [Pochonia chlamydosporia 170]